MIAGTRRHSTSFSPRISRGCTASPWRGSGATRTPAEEIVQRVLIRALDRLHTYKGEAALLTWLCTLCRREIGRWHASRRQRPGGLALRRSAGAARRSRRACGRRRGRSGAELQRRELSRIVQLTLDHLPGRYGDVLEWKYIQELSVEDIADRLGVGYKAAESVLTRARAAFRDGFSLVAGGWPDGRRVAVRDPPRDRERRRAIDAGHKRRGSQRARLLRLAGPRPSAPDARAARVRAAVHQHWQAGNRRRTFRRRAWPEPSSLATAALVFLVARAILTDRRGMPIGEVVAVVERIDGAPRRISDGHERKVRPPSPRTNDSVRTGEWIETDARARVALRFSDGTSVRLDLGSRARLLSARVIELSAGALYVTPAGRRDNSRFGRRLRRRATLAPSSRFDWSTSLFDFEFARVSWS